MNGQPLLQMTAKAAASSGAVRSQSRQEAKRFLYKLLTKKQISQGGQGKVAWDSIKWK